LRQYFLCISHILRESDMLSALSVTQDGGCPGDLLLQLHSTFLGLSSLRLSKLQELKKTDKFVLFQKPDTKTSKRLLILQPLLFLINIFVLILFFGLE